MRKCQIPPELILENILPFLDFRDGVRTAQEVFTPDALRSVYYQQYFTNRLIHDRRAITDRFEHKRQWFLRQIRHRLYHFYHNLGYFYIEFSEAFDEMARARQIGTDAIVSRKNAYGRMFRWVPVHRSVHEFEEDPEDDSEDDSEGDSEDDSEEDPEDDSEGDPEDDSEEDPEDDSNDSDMDLMTSCFSEKDRLKSSRKEMDRVIDMVEEELSAEESSERSELDRLYAHYAHHVRRK